jgi:hypothetical protein
MNICRSDNDDGACRKRDSAGDRGGQEGRQGIRRFLNEVDLSILKEAQKELGIKGSKFLKARLIIDIVALPTGWSPAVWRTNEEACCSYGG